MRKLKLTGLKLTIIGAALTVCGTVEPLLVLIGFVLMIAGLFIGDKVDIGEKENHDTY